MNLDPTTIGYILIFIGRLLEMFGFCIVLVFMFSGVSLKYVFITAGLTVVGMTISIFGYLGGFLSPIASFGVNLFVFPIVLGIAFYAFMEKRKWKIRPPPPPPKGTRCPVCGAFVKQEDEYAVAREGRDLLYFDSKEHLYAFLENFAEYKALKKLNFRKVEDIYIKGKGGWKRGHEDLESSIQ